MRAGIKETDRKGTVADGSALPNELSTRSALAASSIAAQLGNLSGVIDPDKIKRKALQVGLRSPGELASLDSRELLGLILLPGTAAGQQQSLRDQLVGTWMVVSWDQVSKDGSKFQRFGANPKGVIVFTAEGRFVYLFSRNDIPKVASNNRSTATPEESKAIVHGSIGTSGTFSLAGKELSLKVENSTFTNWVDTDQKRTVTIAGDELKWHNPAGSGGGVVELAFKRIK